MEILKIYKKIAIIFAIFLSGCGEIKRTLGIEKVPPDSTDVSPAVRGLEVPPNFLLNPDRGDLSSQRPLSEAEKEILNRIQPLP